MVGTKGKSGGRRPNQTGRPPKPENRRHNISIPDEVWAYLIRNKNASAEIERLAREAIAGEGSNGSSMQQS
jgi:hypothetical protein